MTEATLATVREMLRQSEIPENETQGKQAQRESRELNLFKEPAVMRRAPLMVESVIGPTELFAMLLRAVATSEERLAKLLIKTITSRNAAERIDWAEALSRMPDVPGLIQRRIQHLIRSTDDEWADARRILDMAPDDRAAAGREAFALLQHRSSQFREFEHIEVVIPRVAVFDHVAPGADGMPAPALP